MSPRKENPFRASEWTPEPHKVKSMSFGKIFFATLLANLATFALVGLLLGGFAIVGSRSDKLGQQMINEIQFGLQRAQQSDQQKAATELLRKLQLIGNQNQDKR